MNGKHFSHLESIENALESPNSANGLFNHSEIPNLIESHSSKSVTITFIDPGGTVSHIVSEAKFGKESTDPQTTYLVIPTSAARDARYGGLSVTGCEDLNVDAIQGVQVDFADEGSFESLETNLPPTGNEHDLCASGSIEAAGDIFSDSSESKGVHTIECFENEVLLKDCSESTLNFRRTYHDSLGIETSNENSHSRKSSKLPDNFDTNVFCLVCAKNLSNHIEAMLVSSSTMSSTRRPATTLLAKTLGDPLSVFTSPGCALCCACFRLLELVDTLEHRLHRATSLLLSRYWPKQQHSNTKQSSQSPKSTSRTCKQDARWFIDQTVHEGSPTKCNTKQLVVDQDEKPSPFTLVPNPVLRKNEHNNILKDSSQSSSGYSAAVSADQNDNESLATVKLADGDGLDDEYEAETVIKIEEKDDREDEAEEAATAETNRRGEGGPGLDRRKRGRPRKYNKNIKCNFCQKLFRPKYYRVHLNSHTREKQFPCSGCSLVFYSKSSLLSHCRRNHDGPSIKKFHCAECGKGFIYSREMERHVNTVHKNVRQFDCKVCKTSFKHVAHLNYHMRSHTGEKPNSCHVCSRRFRRPGELKNHVIRVHGMEYCGKYRERISKLCEVDGVVSVAKVVTVGTSDPDLFIKAEG